MKDKTHYTVSEVAEMLGVHTQTLHKWIREGAVQTDGRFGIRPKSPHRIHISEVQRMQQLMHSA